MKLYGRYHRPIRPMSYGYQKDLEAAYKSRPEADPVTCRFHLVIIGAASSPASLSRTASDVWRLYSRLLLLRRCLALMATLRGQPSRRDFQTSDGVKLSFLEAGQNGSGNQQSRRLRLVPGWTMPATIWRYQVQAFGRRYYTLAFDPRGQGESDVPAAGYTAERRATDIKEFLVPLFECTSGRMVARRHRIVAIRSYVRQRAARGLGSGR